MPLSEGQTVENRYRIAKLLGQGGMGAVYRAWDTRLNHPVALKEMIPQAGLNAAMLAQLRQQFEQEAQVLATFTHPSLVRVTDYFAWQNNEYLVMDFVEGESLAERIEREGAQPESQVLEWAEQLLSALTYCHKQGILHRDIKPLNIIVTPEGRAVLVDFGLVKLWNPNDPQTRTVMRGAGTPEYAPPEQYDIGAGHTDPRSDIYSMGATIYHALTGHMPPTATHRMASPASFAPPRRVNAAVSTTTEAVVLKSLEMAMENRYQSAEEMAQALNVSERATRVVPRRATPERAQAPSAAEPEPPAKRKRGFLMGGVGLTVAGLLCLALAVGAALLGLYLIGKDKATPLPPTPTFAPPATPRQPTATAPLPTSTPRPINTPAPVDTGNALFQDDFSDPSSGWEVGDYDGGSVGYKDGIYFVRSENNGDVMWGVANRSFENIIIEVDATQVLAPTNDNNAYGVKCREQSGNGYGFVISGDGYYSIQIIMDGDWESLVDWTSSDAINQGNGTNHIRAACDGSHLALAVNGELLAEVEDSTYTEGNISLTAATFEDEPTEIHYDNLVASPSVEIILQDDFSDSSSGWEVGNYDTGDVGYTEGAYFVTSTENEQMMWGLANDSFDDTIVEVDATQISAPDNDNNAYGVMCRVQSNDDGYLLRVSGDGYYAIHVIVENEFNPLVDWTTSDAINQGDATNHIRAVCDGANLTLTVNGELLAEAEDYTFAEGDIALTTTTFEEDPTEVHFDDLVVYAP
ncbi:MAG TPA: protein kinase [Thermoflexia bacterium]|nr:protein kinase [Thermoflexia bacterium]